MKTIERVGRTVDEALSQALKELGLSRSEVEVEVLEESSKGLFGLIGTKQARIRIHLPEPKPVRVEVPKAEPKPTLVTTPAAVAKPPVEALTIAKEFLQKTVDLMGLEAGVEAIQDDEAIRLTVVGLDAEMLIGPEGKTLDAAQYLTSLAVNRLSDEWVRVLVDASGYREEREQALRQKAREVAETVKAAGKKASLQPMNPQERRIIHTELQEMPGIVTFSEGKEPHRRVVVAPADES